MLLFAGGKKKKIIIHTHAWGVTNVWSIRGQRVYIYIFCCCYCCCTKAEQWTPATSTDKHFTR